MRVEREAIDALGPGGGDSDEGGGDVVISGEWYFRWCWSFNMHALGVLGWTCFDDKWGEPKSWVGGMSRAETIEKLLI